MREFSVDMATRNDQTGKDMPPRPILAERPWLPADCERLVQKVAGEVAGSNLDDIEAGMKDLILENARVQDACINLDPAGNIMNPKAEAILAEGLGSRPSLGYPGDKYEMGIEALERIEIVAAQLAAEVFRARHVEIRVPSGALANLYVFMATASPGDVIIAPPASIGGHVTHHSAGGAGRYGLRVQGAPVDARRYSVDVEALRKEALRLRPALISIGGSLNLFPHPIRELRAIADEVGAYLLFDAAHMSGMIAGDAWQQPLKEGAHVMTMSTYKSLAGPPSGLIVTNDPRLAERLEAIAYPALTANFDVGKSAALALTLLDWKECGRDYAARMAQSALTLGEALVDRGIPVFARDRGITTSHQIAVEAHPYEGGQAAAKRLRRANLLASGIGLPIEPVEGDMNGIRFGTTETARLGMAPDDMPRIAGWVADVLNGSRDPDDVAEEVRAFRQGFRDVHFVRGGPAIRPPRAQSSGRERFQPPS